MEATPGTSLQHDGHLCAQDGSLLLVGSQRCGASQLQAFSPVFGLHHFGMHRDSCCTLASSDT
jgi:hypothetical protein